MRRTFTLGVAAAALVITITGCSEHKSVTKIVEEAAHEHPTAWAEFCERTRATPGVLASDLVAVIRAEAVSLAEERHVDPDNLAGAIIAYCLN